MPASWVRLFRLAPDETIWIAHPRGSQPPLLVADLHEQLAELTVPLVVGRLADAGARERERLLARADSHQARADDWRQSYRTLRATLPVRIVVRVNAISARFGGQAGGRAPDRHGS